MRRFACLGLAALGLGAPAIAKDHPSTGQLPSPEEVLGRDTLSIGVGVGILPDYEGSDDYRVVPLAAVRGQYHGISFSTRGAYLYVDVIPGRGKKAELIAGPIVGARMSKPNDSDDGVVKLLPHRKTAIEVGGFAGVSFHQLTNPYDTLSLRLDVLHDVADAHKSTVLDPNIEFSTPLSRTTYAGVSISAEFVSDRFANYYFGITPAQSLATGGALPVYDASGGMKNLTAGLLLNQSLSGDLLHGLSIFGIGQYSRLLGDFKRSPIVAQRGSAGQWTGALGLAYTW
jgi:outer membrane scaffolding protein for murein synthesis (MipA/OmpV family)